MTTDAAAIHIGPAKPLGRGASLGIVLLAYITSLGAAVAVGAVMGSAKPLLTVAVADIVATVVIFIWSRVVNNSSMYDIYWSVVPPVIAVYFLLQADAGVPALRQVLVLTVVWLWAVRLTGNWARTWSGLDHEDWRYTDARGGKVNYWIYSLVGFHIFPTVQVYLGCLALYPALATGTNAVGPLDWVAFVIGVGAVVLELVADEQLHRFNKTKAPGEVCRRGLWNWSRHPNYLGEIAFWVSLWLFALAADLAWWWTIIGPLAMIGMFLAASIPMMEKRSLERRPEFRVYMDEVPMVLPRRPANKA